MERHWIILQRGTSDIWSNAFGWVEDNTYDLFTDNEKASLNLPIEGYWARGKKLGLTVRAPLCHIGE